MSYVAVILAIGAGTYLLRLSFIGIVGDRTMPEWALVPLRFVAPAVLAALIAPAVLLNEDALDLSPASNPRAIAALVALLVAWKTRSVPIVIAAGLMIVWAFQALF
jgi:branched-subunit amino acid transport protein